MKYIIELTNICNMRCSMCPRNHIDMKLGFMSLATWHNIISDIPAGSTILPFWRGESTLHPYFCEMIDDLKEYNVVLATNGTNPNRIIMSLNRLSAINVSIHNIESYDGYLKIKEHVFGSSPNVIASTVEGEDFFTNADRYYRRHTINGEWGRVNGIKSDIGRGKTCVRLSETVFSWDGGQGRCCYVWDTEIPIGPYPDEVCKKCSQWIGNGKTI